MDSRIKLVSTTGYYNHKLLNDKGKEIVKEFLENSKIALDDTVYFHKGMAEKQFRGCQGGVPITVMGVPFTVVGKRNVCTFIHKDWNNIENRIRPIGSEHLILSNEYLHDWNPDTATIVTIQHQLRPQIKTGAVSEYNGSWYSDPCIVKENNWVPVFPNGIPNLDGIDFCEYLPWSDHASWFCMMVGDGEHENKPYQWLANNVDDFYDGDPCDDCWDPDCDSCTGLGEVATRGKKVPALLGTDSSCWGNGMPVLRAVQEAWGQCPTHMILMFDSDSLWCRDNDLSDIMRFYGYMQDAGIIPTKGVKLLSEEDVDKNSTVYFSGIQDMSPEKMYFIFCCMRTPVQHPGLVRLTNRLIEEKDMDPLYAFIMAQVLHPSFQGGHAVVNPSKLRYSTGTSWEDRVKNNIPKPAPPKLNKVLEFALRAVKLLDKDRGEREKIKNSNSSIWTLDLTLTDEYEDYRPRDVRPMNIRYSKKKLALTPDNMLGLRPRERRIAV